MFPNDPSAKNVCLDPPNDVEANCTGNTNLDSAADKAVRTVHNMEDNKPWYISQIGTCIFENISVPLTEKGNKMNWTAILACVMRKAKHRKENQPLNKTWLKNKTQSQAVSKTLQNLNCFLNYRLGVICVSFETCTLGLCRLQRWPCQLTLIRNVENIRPVSIFQKEVELKGK